MSRPAREEILGRLRRALDEPELRFPPASPPPLQPGEHMTVTEAGGSPEELALAFGRALEGLHGTWTLARSVDEAGATLGALLQRWQAEVAAGGEYAPARLLSWVPGRLPLPGIEQRLADIGFELVAPASLREAAVRAEVEPIRYGLTGVDAAIASTGSIVVTSDEGKSRAASLLPLVHIALVPWGRLYPSLEAWLASQRAREAGASFVRDHANLALITGPSKSADIEMNLTLGVHGPQRVHAILFDDRP